MRILAIVPDPRAALGLGPALTAIPRATVRVVAYGQATAAALPSGLDVSVYPVREGTCLPAAFYRALLAHERPDAVLTPAGAATAAPVPTLLVDLNGPLPADGLPPLDDPSDMVRLEAVTGDAERRRALVRGGLFFVRLELNLFSGPGRLGPAAGAILSARFASLLNIPPAPAERLDGPSRGPGPEPVRVVKIAPGPDATHPAPKAGPGAVRPAPVSARQAPPPSAHPPPAPPPSALNPFSYGSDAGRTGFASRGASPGDRPPVPAPSADLDDDILAVDTPVSPVASGVGSAGALPPAAAAPAVDPDLVPFTPLAPRPEEVHGPERYRGRHTGAKVLVLASAEALECLTPLELTQSIVVSTPRALSALNARMGIANYVCFGTEPIGPGDRDVLGSSRSVAVHADAPDLGTFTECARARVPLCDLRRAGGPGLGWSDELTTGFFPSGGDVALAVQWAAWVGATEIVVAGAAHAPAERRQFIAAARELLGARGIALREDGNAEFRRRTGAVR